MIDKNIFPKELCELRQWLNWRLERDPKSHRMVKVPYNPHTGHRASSVDPATWGTLDEAMAAWEKYQFSGIGFVFTEESGYVGIDIDKCLIDGKLNDIATAILAKTPPTYVEISPSGTGIHFFIKGKMPSGGGNRNKKTGVEMYGNARYFTMTCNRWRNCADIIADDNGILDWIHTTYVKPKKQEKLKKSSVNQAQGASQLTDEKLLEMAKAAKDKEAFDFLWRGAWQGKYPSQSEADFALCCKLAFWSNKDEAQMHRLFRQSGLMREKWDAQHYAGGATYGETSVRKACEITKDTYAPNTLKKKRPVSIFEQDGLYFRKKGENIHQFTNFIIKPIELVIADDEAQLSCEFINEDGKTSHQYLLADDFSNLQKFKKILNKKSLSFSFFGREDDLEALKQYLDKLDKKEKTGVKALGIYRHKEQMVFVTTLKAQAAGGVSVDTIIQLDKYKNLDSRILDAPMLTRDEFLSISELILHYNVPEKTVPILAWVASCFIKPFLKRQPIDAKFPHLFLVGQNGGGKSNTLEKIILPIFVRSKVKASSQVTPFTIMKESSSSNVIPQTFDEFKPSQIDKFKLQTLYNHFREAFDGHEISRGKADQSSITYDLLAPIIVTGEESAQESAIRERSIELLFTRKDLTNADYVETFKRLKRQRNILPSFGRSLLDTALRLTVSDVAVWYNEGEALFMKEEFSARITSNLACIYAGLKLVQRLCNNYGNSWDYFFNIPMDKCNEYLARSVREYLLHGNKYNKSVIEETFEVMARMKLKANVHFVFESAGRHLTLWFSEVYDRFTKYRKDYALTGECLSAEQFKQQLRHSEYYVKSGQNQRYGKQTHRSWTINYEKLMQVADVSGFLEVEQDE